MRIRRFAPLVLVCLVAAACGGGGDDDDAAPQESTTSEAAVDDTTTTAAVEADIDVETISLTHAPNGVAINEDTLYYVSADDNVLVEVDLAAGEETQELEVGAYPLAVAYTDTAIWVTLGTFGDTAVVRVDPATFKVVATVDVEPGDGPSGVAASDTVAWAQVDGVGRTIRINPKTNTIAATVDPQPKVSSGGGAWISATDDAVWVVDRDEGEVIRIDPTTNKIVAEISDLGYESEDAGDGLTSILSQGPVGVTVGDDGTVWIVSEAEGEGSTTTGEGFTVAGTLFKVDPETNAVVEDLPLEQSPAQANTLPKPGFAVDGDDGWYMAGDRAWHIDLTDGTSLNVLEKQLVTSAIFGGVAIGTERVWFAAEAAGGTGNALYGVDPESLP